VRLRLNNENEDFRRRLNDFVHGLGEASLQDLDRVTAEVARGIGSLLIDHQQQLKKSSPSTPGSMQRPLLSLF